MLIETDTIIDSGRACIQSFAEVRAQPSVCTKEGWGTRWLLLARTIVIRAQ